jgi:pentose-5-phosphate-3-epimerase/CBS domain-containing protein
MLVSASILAVKDNFIEYANNLKFAGADYLHIDLFQNSNDNFKLTDILSFDKSSLPLDIHLIYEEISANDINVINKSSAKYLSLQFESLRDKASSIETASSFEGSLGIALTPKTDVAEIDQVANHLNHILVMCTEPGISGKKFDEQSYALINAIRNKYPNIKIHADGGIETNISKKMGALGVSLVVSGSYLASNIDILHTNIYNIKYSNEENINVKRNMIKLNSLPLVHKNTNLFEMLNIMNLGKIGCCFLVDNDTFMGIITDGDIRRAYLKYGKDIFDTVAQEIVNEHILLADSAMTILEVHNLIIQQKKWWVKVVPVIEQHKLIGALRLL